MSVYDILPVFSSFYFLDYSMEKRKRIVQLEKEEYDPQIRTFFPVVFLMGQP